MIYRQSFHNEVVRYVAALVLVLGGLVAMIAMGRLFRDASALDAEAVLVLLGLQMVKLTPQLLTASLFAGLVLAFGRMSQFRELTAWTLAGLRSSHWYAATLVLAVPMAVTVWIVALHGAPWSVRYEAEYQRALATNVKLEETNPGLFGEIRDQNMVYHLEAVSANRRQALGIFIAREDSPGSMQIVQSQRARTDIDLGGLQSLALEEGRMQLLNFPVREASSVSFSSAEFNLGSQPESFSLRRRALPLGQLGASPAERTEYLWRHGFGLTMILLSLLALPFSKVIPGTGRGYQVLLAVVLYWLFYAVNGFAKDLGENGSLTPLAATAIAPGLLAALWLALAALQRRSARL